MRIWRTLLNCATLPKRATRATKARAAAELIQRLFAWRNRLASVAVLRSGFLAEIFRPPKSFFLRARAAFLFFHFTLARPADAA
jgi:hypothetical protein